MLCLSRLLDWIEVSEAERGERSALLWVGAGEGGGESDACLARVCGVNGGKAAGMI